MRLDVENHSNEHLYDCLLHLGMPVRELTFTKDEVEIFKDVDFVAYFEKLQTDDIALSHRGRKPKCTRSFCLCGGNKPFHWGVNFDHAPFVCLSWRDANGLWCQYDNGGKVGKGSSIFGREWVSSWTKEKDDWKW